LVQSGALGEIFHVSGEYFQSHGLPHAGCPLVWRFVKEIAITGTLGDLGCHMIDLIRFITGREFTRITSDYDTFIHTRTLPGDDYGKLFGDVTVDDYINIAAQMEGPIAANLNITRYAYGRGNYQRIEVYGDKGAIRYTLEDKDTLEINIGNKPMEESHIWTNIPVPGWYASNQAQSFADILNGCGDGLAATMHDGWQTQKVIDAAVEAGKNYVEL